MAKLELSVSEISIVLPIRRVSSDGVSEVSVAIVPVNARRVLHAAEFNPRASHDVAAHKFARNHSQFGVVGRGWKPVEGE